MLVCSRLFNCDGRPSAQASGAGPGLRPVQCSAANRARQIFSVGRLFFQPENLGKSATGPDFFKSSSYTFNSVNSVNRTRINARQAAEGKPGDRAAFIPEATQVLAAGRCLPPSKRPAFHVTKGAAAIAAIMARRQSAGRAGLLQPATAKPRQSLPPEAVKRHSTAPSPGW